MYKLAELKKKLEDLKIYPKKALGQNFLIHQVPIDRAVSILKDYPEAKVYEIGPGLGALTEPILEMKRDLTLIELDSVFAKYWKERGVDVIHHDALKVDWVDLLSAPSVLISNLPYQISASLVVDMSVLDGSKLQAMILMFQKEVGERIQAKEKTSNYGLLSVIGQAFWDVNFVIDAGPKDFYPPPKIASRILHFKRKPQVVDSAEKFLRMVKASFAQRRKLLKKNLAAVTTAKVEDILEELGLPVNVRAEDLSPTDYINLYKRLHQ